MSKKSIGKIIQKILAGIVFSAPLILGVIGYEKALGEGFINSFYHTVRLYGLNVDVKDNQINLWLEIARWCSAAAVATFIYSVLKNAVYKLKAIILSVSKNSVGLHGDSEMLANIKTQKGYRFIDGTERSAANAQRQLFMFNTEENFLSYIEEHAALLNDKTIKKNYICTNLFREGNLSFNGAVIVNLPQICARLYWEKYFLRKAEQDIVIIGFGNYGEALLTQALLINVIGLNTTIRYHIFPLNDTEASYFEDFLMCHQGIERFASIVYFEKEQEILNDCDGIVIHKESYLVADELLYSANRVILASDNDRTNLKVMRNIKDNGPIIKLYMHIRNNALLDQMWDNTSDGYCINAQIPNSYIEKKDERRQYICTFGTIDDLASLDAIFHDELSYIAKLAHARWSMKVEGDLEDYVIGLENIVNTKEFENEWNAQSAFIQYSNIAQADHISHKVRLVMGEDADVNAPDAGERFAEAYKMLDDSKKSLFDEIEHLRWMRYYYFNNWKYGTHRSDFLRTHFDLVPYRDLSRTEKEKDNDTFALEAYLKIRNTKKTRKR